MKRRGFLGALGAIGAAIVGRKAIPPVVERAKLTPPFLKIDPVTVPIPPAPAFDQFAMYVDIEAGERLDPGDICYVRNDGKVYRGGSQPFGVVTATRITAQVGGSYRKSAIVDVSPWKLPRA